MFRSVSRFTLRRRFLLLPFLATASIAANAQTEPPKRALDAKTVAAIDPGARRHCDSHFPASVQGLSKTSCYLGLVLFRESAQERDQAEGRAERAFSQCAALTQTKTRSLLACRLGVQIADDGARKRDTFSARMKLCQDHYPLHTETDAFLQESCWVGATLAFESKEPTKKPRLALCSDFSIERAFIGPCAVGLSLAAETVSPSQGAGTAEQNRLCARYFDQRQFQQGYRGCVNARALALEWNRKAASLPGACSALTAGKNDDVERAACVVGGSIWHNLAKGPGGANPRFGHCGEKKVNWTERDALACLTAAALLDLGGEAEARRSCQLIFAGSRRHKNTRREECYRAVATLADRGVPAAPATAAGALPKLAPLKTDADEPDLWPEAPDTPEEETEANEAPAAEEGAVNTTVNATEGPRPRDKNSLSPASGTPRTPGSGDPRPGSASAATPLDP